MASKKKQNSLTWLRDNGFFVVLTTLLAVVFFTGGSAREDVTSLVILRPFAILCLGFGLWGISREELQPFKLPLIFAFSGVLLVAIHLIPLPPSIWMALPGREIVAEAGALALDEQPWRPLSIVPWRSWNALFALMVPLSVLILAIRCSESQRRKLLHVFLALGLITCTFGALQAISSGNSALYFYRVTNDGVAVGLFANRNHQAVFLACMIPMLALFASRKDEGRRMNKVRIAIAAAGALFLIPLTLITGSRAGIFLLLFGFLLIPLIFAMPKRQGKKPAGSNRKTYAMLAGGVLTLGITTLFFAKAEAAKRLFELEMQGDLRVQIIQPMIEMIGTYFPFGSGIGTFVETYQIGEPSNMLSTSYVNHAHNDWLEILLTGGLPALAIIGLLIYMCAITAIRLYRFRPQNDYDIRQAKLGLIIVLFLGIASIVDYPLRAPSIGCLFIVAIVWMTQLRQGSRDV